MFKFILPLAFFVCTTYSNEIASLNMDTIITYLLGDDDRLVRFNLPDAEAKQRQRIICSETLIEVLTILSNHESLRIDKAKAIKVLTLCAIENPNNRDTIGRYEDGRALEQIVFLLTSSLGMKDSTGIADAAEAIWILSFNHGGNIQGFSSSGALIALINTVLSPYNQERDKMWSLAAIQNLAASYCDTPTGHCWWDFDQVDGLHLYEKTALVIDGSNIRKQLLKDENLLLSIEKIICEGAAKQSSFPSRAKHNENYPEMSTWSAIGALRNLALFEDGISIVLNMNVCLCSLLMSPDWLESSKARDVLVRTGLIESCENLNF